MSYKDPAKLVQWWSSTGSGERGEWHLLWRVQPQDMQSCQRVVGGAQRAADDERKTARNQEVRWQHERHPTVFKLNSAVVHSSLCTASAHFYSHFFARRLLMSKWSIGPIFSIEHKTPRARLESLISHWWDALSLFVHCFCATRNPQAAIVSDCGHKVCKVLSGHRSILWMWKPTNRGGGCYCVQCSTGVPHVEVASFITWLCTISIQK